jgi:F-type H+-transporting ATPase subunit a
MAAEGHAAGHGPTAGEYIAHHLKHLSNREAVGPVDFGVLHYDSMFFSLALGVLGCFLL